MDCPACARPIAMARANCVYCGAALPAGAVEEAAKAARQVLQSKTLASLEAVSQGIGREVPPRRYVILDTGAASLEAIAEGCSVSVWEARQWQAASRHRLVKVSTEPADGPLESSLIARGLNPIILPEAVVMRSRSPILLESIDASAEPPLATFRDDPDAPPARREVRPEEIVLIVSAPIKRQRVKDQVSARARVETRLEDAWLVHLHLKGEPRPLEIDPLRTGYEGAGVTSAYMQTLEFVRRLAATAPHDEAFRNMVPALSPGVDPLRDLDALAGGARKKNDKDPKVVVLDNVAQFREYSAWRGALEGALRERAEAGGQRRSS
jgi:hypothetical protein